MQKSIEMKNKAERIQEKKETKKPEAKKTNKTWEAFGRSKGCFIINDPQFML